MNFLIIVYKGIGDVILTTPLLKAIKKYFPDSKIYFLVKKYSADILKNNPYIEKVLIREELSLKELRGYKIDVSIDYMLSSSSAFYSVASGAKKRIAFYRKWRSLIYNNMVKNEYHGYNARQKFQYLKPFGIKWEEIDDIKPEIYPDENNKIKIREILGKKNVDINDKIITFDITSPRAVRQMSADKFIYIADRIVESGFKTIFPPALWELDYVKDSIERYSKYKDKHIVISGITTLDLSYLISLSKLHIGTSSSPMHMAVSFDVPTFTVYSPYSDPKVWSPPLDIHRGVQGELDKLDAINIYNQISSFISFLNI
jgi:ADP-heptose:LPS heptosyltransferase